jgi:hypothetical protein
MRESAVRGAAIDIDDFERRLRGVEPPRKSPGDPLSELARLMQGEEQAQAARRYDRMFASEAAPSDWRNPATREEARDASHEEAFAAELRGAIQEDYPRARTDAGPAGESADYSEEVYSVDPRARGNDFAAADLAARHFAGRPSTQRRANASEAWSRDQEAELVPDSEDNIAYDDMSEAPARGGFLRLRPWHAVAVAALLASSLLAWGFAKRGGMIGSREIALINAPDGPAKVPPAANADAGVGKPDAAVLDRHETAQVKRVVSHQEQAVEPKVESRANYNGAADADGGQASPTGLPPKKIRTVSVRPDGSLISSGDVPPAVEKAAGSGSGSRESAKHASTTPAAPARPSATPRADKPAKPKAPQKVAAVDDDAEAKAPASTQKIGKGGFAVQFGAAANEAEAHALVSKVATKYGSRLGGHKPTFKVAKVGDRTVYRVRVSGMSKESAASVCGNVKSSGGSCFIAGD